MKKSYWVSRILPCFMVTGLFLILVGCNSTPSTSSSSSPQQNVQFSTPADMEQYPKKIALLLPLQGELGAQGTAIRDGFFAAYYIDAKNHTTDLPTLTVLDTHNDKDILSVYQKAIAQGAEFIVGPLTKPALATLLKSGDPQVPILALNSVDNQSDKLYQFGLSPENEASQAAIRAYQNGSRHALLFIQEGAWGQRVADAFIQTFKQAGGDIAEVVYFTTRSDLSVIVKNALHISSGADASLRKATTSKAEFSAKAREDVDMVFMAAMPMQARQIPPLLAFYYAKSWPIYATSSVFSGTPNPKIDQDLNGVTFCDIPWLVETPRDESFNATNQAVLQLWPAEPRTQARLYAMGVDAYEIIPLLSHMASQSSFAFNGATGVLTMNGRHQIQRTLPCTQFVQGVPLKQ